MISEKLNLFRDAASLVKAVASPANSGITFAMVAGNFDGMHKGHQALLERTVASAKKHWAQPLVFLGEPPFGESVARLQRQAQSRTRKQSQKNGTADGESTQKTPALRIMSAADKLEFIASYGIRWVWMQRTTEDFLNLTSNEFADGVLARLPLVSMLVGHDYRYGADRGGDPESLRQWGARAKVEIDILNELLVGGVRASSTLLRSYIATGEFARAAQMLGRYWGFTRRVQRGRQLGRTLGFPTANMPVPQNTCLRGVYAVDVRLQENGQGQDCAGVLNVGSRPTVAGKYITAEVHIFDFSGDIYGQRISVYPTCKLREEQKFANLDQLKQAVECDIQAAKAALAANRWRKNFSQQ